MISNKGLSCAKGKRVEFSDSTVSDREVVSEKDILDYIPLLRIRAYFNSSNELLKADIRTTSEVVLSTSTAFITSPHKKEYLKDVLKTYEKDWEVVNVGNLVVYTWTDIPLVLVTYSGVGLIDELVLGDY